MASYGNHHMGGSTNLPYVHGIASHNTEMASYGNHHMGGSTNLPYVHGIAYHNTEMVSYGNHHMGGSTNLLHVQIDMVLYNQKTLVWHPFHPNLELYQ